MPLNTKFGGFSEAYPVAILDNIPVDTVWGASTRDFKFHPDTNVKTNFNDLINHDHLDSPRSNHLTSRTESFVTSKKGVDHQVITDDMIDPVLLHWEALHDPSPLANKSTEITKTSINFVLNEAHTGT
ncbi:hypothetical protein B0T20DRAFT_497672 [Sordaria brevicollis]|uniref:Uncharacterized protein n=1 Tax=Sordaria brevicollis TaxID=83679 RepID=A0AAE0UCU6_SORBR|nr:hypothetical protein B0T20DRAFT_497672 [Sordaria brevicollis]